MKLIYLFVALIIINEVTSRYVYSTINHTKNKKEGFPVMVLHIKKFGNSVSDFFHSIASYIKVEVNDMQHFIDKPHVEEAIYSVLVKVSDTVKKIKIKCNSDELEVLKRCEIID